MANVLYLDTARLGQMSPRARRATVDFSRFASEYGGSLYLGDFLVGGGAALPERLARSFPALAEWKGVTDLKTSLRVLAGSSRDTQVLIAARSATLMKLAARLLVRPCRNVLLTDLTWPAYEQILRRQLPTSACTVTRVPIRRAILRGEISRQELIETLSREFVRRQCDGLFLPLVDNLGIRMPLRDIVTRIASMAELRFVVADGAQALNHMPLDLAKDYCDFLVAGCHKWLRAFTPMGIGFFGHPRSREYIRSATDRWTVNGIIDDPLLEFSQELENETPSRFGETVNVSALLSSNGATRDALSADTSRLDDASAVNRQRVVAYAREAGWKWLAPCDDFSSRIVVLRSTDKRIQCDRAEHVRRRFLHCGLSLTAYESGVIRISLPASSLSEADLDIVRAAFSHVSG